MQCLRGTGTVWTTWVRHPSLDNLRHPALLWRILRAVSLETGKTCQPATSFPAPQSVVRQAHILRMWGHGLNVPTELLRLASTASRAMPQQGSGCQSKSAQRQRRTITRTNRNLSTGALRPVPTSKMLQAVLSRQTTAACQEEAAILNSLPTRLPPSWTCYALTQAPVVRKLAGVGQAPTRDSLR